nr:hypothetical transcript [Hymenolepis microstoma]
MNRNDGFKNGVSLDFQYLIVAEGEVEWSDLKQRSYIELLPSQANNWLSDNLNLADQARVNSRNSLMTNIQSLSPVYNRVKME